MNSLAQEPTHVRSHMRQALRRYGDLVGAALLIAATGPLFFLADDGILRWIGAFGLCLFLPGYLFLAAVEGGPHPWGRGRVALAAPGLSIAIVSILAIAAAMQSSLTREIMGLLLLTWNILSLVVATIRRNRHSLEDSLAPTRTLGPSVESETHPECNLARLGLYVAMALLAFAVMRLVAGAIDARPAYTELYLLGTDGELGADPIRASPGDVVGFAVWIANHEGETLRYSLSVCPGDARCDPGAEIVLDDGEQSLVWVNASAPDVLGPAKILFELVRSDQEGSYREVHAWIDVTSSLE